MPTIEEAIDAWDLPPDIAQRFKDWLSAPSQGWKVDARLKDSIYTITEEDLKAAGFTVLLERRLILAKLRSLQGALLEGREGSVGDISPSLERFAKWATTFEEENQNDPWLEAPEGTFFLGSETLGSRLYVREAYWKLADRLEYLPGKGKRHGVIGGNPGLGKSLFALWMLVRWLRKGINVLWHSSTDEFFYYRSGTVTYLVEREAHSLLRSQATNLRYIVDGTTPYQLLEVDQSFVAHSPDSSKYKEYMKLSNAANSPHYMPHWDIEELEIVRVKMHPAITRQEMKQLVARRGAVPRYVLTEGLWTDMDEWMDEAITAVEWKDVVGAHPGSTKSSHRVAAIHPTHWREGNFTKYQLTFLSVAIKGAVFAQLTKVVTDGVAQVMILVDNSAQGLTADLSTCMEETIVHNVLQNGGSWPLRECPPEYDKRPMATREFVRKQAGKSSSRASNGQQVAFSSRGEERSSADSTWTEAHGQEKNEGYSGKRRHVRPGGAGHRW